MELKYSASDLIKNSNKKIKIQFLLKYAVQKKNRHSRREILYFAFFIFINYSLSIFDIRFNLKVIPYVIIIRFI